MLNTAERLRPQRNPASESHIMAEHHFGSAPDSFEARVSDPFIARDFRRRMSEVTDQITLFDGVPQALEDLHAHSFKLGIVTSNSRDNITRIGTCLPTSRRNSR